MGAPERGGVRCGGESSLVCSGKNDEAAVAGAEDGRRGEPREALGFVRGMTGSHWKVLPPGLQYEDVIWRRELTVGHGSLIIQFTHALSSRLEMWTCIGRSKTRMGWEAKAG